MTPRTIPAAASLLIGLVNSLPANADNHSEIATHRPTRLCNVMQDAGLASHFMPLRLCQLDQQLRDTASAPLAPTRPHL